MLINHNRIKKGLVTDKHTGCPLTHNHSQWCFNLCDASKGGKGYCGRISPHGVTGRTQKAIERYKKSILPAH